MTGRPPWRALLAALCALLAPAPASAAVQGGPDTGPLVRTGRWLTDDQGRVFVGHGVNVVKKVAPFVRGEFGEADARMLADEGFTVARIGFIWEGVEPQPGSYDDGYIAKVIALNALLAKYGIRTLVDFHQDVWSQYSGGDGAPRWATPSGNPLDDFQAFWDDQPGPDGVGLQTHFIAAWRHVVSQFSTSASFANVLGWDPFNEPYAGTKRGCAPFTPCPDFETGELADFYRRVIPAIRAGGGHQVIYPEAIADSGVVAPALPGFADPQTAFQYHFYCNATQTDSRRSRVDEATPEAAACAPVESNNLGNYHAYTKGLNVPALLGEFSCNDVNDDNAQVVDNAGAAFDSWTIWAYYTAADDPADCPGQGLLEDDKTPGRAKADKLDAIVVPHAQAIAGTPTSTSLERESRTYRLTYATSAVPGATLAPGALTQVFVPARAYPDGYAARVTGATVESAPGAPWLLLRSAAGADEVKLTLTPAKGTPTVRPLSTGALPITSAAPPTTSTPCSSRRVIRFTLPRRARLRSVTIDDRRVTSRRTGRMVTVSLRGRAGTVRVRVLARARGRTYRRVATLHLCTRRRSTSLPRRSSPRGP